MQHPINELSADHLLELVSAEVFADEIEQHSPKGMRRWRTPSASRRRCYANATHRTRSGATLTCRASHTASRRRRTTRSYDWPRLSSRWSSRGRGTDCYVGLGAMSDAALETSQAALDGECPDLAARNRRTHGRVHRELRDLRQASYVRRGERTPLGRSLGCRVQRGRGGGGPDLLDGPPAGRPAAAPAATLLEASRVSRRKTMGLADVHRHPVVVR